MPRRQAEAQGTFQGSSENLQPPESRDCEYEAPEGGSLGSFGVRVYLALLDEPVGRVETAWRRYSEPASLEFRVYAVRSCPQGQRQWRHDEEA